MDKRLQRLAAKRGALTVQETDLLRQAFALVYLRHRKADGSVETLAGWHNANGWLCSVFTLPAADAHKKPPANKPLDPASELELLRAVATGDAAAIVMAAELVKWYSRRECEALADSTVAGKERGKKITAKAAALAKKIAPLSNLSSEQAERKLAREGVLVSDSTVRRHRRKKPG